MKRFLAMLMLLAVVLSTSACAREQAAGQSAQSAQNVKAVSNKKGDFASIYLSNIDKDAETYIADFDLNQYLLDSGAISIERLDTTTLNYPATCIAARYPNGIVTVYSFYGDNSDPYAYGYLSEINVFVVEDRFNLNSYWRGESKEDENGLRSEWFHHFYATSSYELLNDRNYEWDFKNFTVKPNGIYYVEAKNGQKSLLSVPDFFDQGFKTSILPYISMKDPSFRKDPMEGKIGGLSDLH